MVNLHDFTGLDSIILGKKATIAELAEQKRKAIEAKSMYGTVVSKPDSDSMTIKDDYGVMHEIRSAFFDSPDRPEIGGAKIRRQKVAYAAQFGLDIDQVTDQHIKDWGKHVSAATAKMGFNEGDRIQYAPTGEESNLAGDDRIISEIFNADNEQLSELTNTGALNTAVAAPWNQERLIEANRLRTAFRQANDPGYVSGYDEEGNARTVQQVDGTFTYGERDHLRGNNLPSAMAVEKSHKDNWGKPGELANYVAKAVANTRDLGKAAQRQIEAIGNGRSTNALTDIEGITDWNIDNAGLIYDEDVLINDAEEKMYFDILKKRAGPGGALTAEEQKFWNSPKRKILSDISKTVTANQKDQDAIDKSADAFRSRIFANGEDRANKAQFDKIMKKQGWLAAAANLITSNPVYVIAELATSLPTMAAAMTVPGMVAIYKQKQEDAYAQRRRENPGQKLTEYEINVTKAASVVAALLERVGAEIIFKKLPGIDKLGRELYKGSPLASRILTPFTSVLFGAAGEGGQEALTTVAEQAASGAGISKEFDTDEIGFAAAVGVGGGGAIKSAGGAVDLLAGQTGNMNRQNMELDKQLLTPDLIGGTAEGKTIANRIAEIDKILGEDTTTQADPVRQALLPEREQLVARLAEPNPEALSPEKRASLQKEYDELSAHLDGDPAATRVKIKDRLAHLNNTLVDGFTLADVPSAEVTALKEEKERLTNELEGDPEQTIDRTKGIGKELVDSIAAIDAQLAGPLSPEEDAKARKNAADEIEQLHWKDEIYRYKEAKQPTAKPAAEEAPKKPKTTREVIDSAKVLDLDTISLQQVDDILLAMEIQNKESMPQSERDELSAEIERYTDAYADKDTAVSDVNGSIDALIGEKSDGKSREQLNTELTELEAKQGDLSPIDNEVFQLVKEIIDNTARLPDGSAKNKESLAEVEADVIEGRSVRLRGFKAYLADWFKAKQDTEKDPDATQAALDVIKEKLITHTLNMTGKARAFNEAVKMFNQRSLDWQAANRGNPDFDPKTPNPDGQVVVVTSRKSAAGNQIYTAQVMPEAEYLQQKKDKNFINLIDETSWRLTAAINKEAAYGVRIVKLARAYDQSTFAKSAAQDQASLDSIQASLNSLATTVEGETTRDSDAPKGPKKPDVVDTPAPKKDSANAEKPQTAEQAGATTGNNRNPVRPSTTEGSAPTSRGPVNDTVEDVPARFAEEDASRNKNGVDQQYEDRGFEDEDAAGASAEQLERAGIVENTETIGDKFAEMIAEADLTPEARAAAEAQLVELKMVDDLINCVK